MPYRIASPPEPDPPEVEEPYVAVLRSQERRTRIGAAASIAILVAIGGVLYAAPKPKLDSLDASANVAARRAQARAAVAGARSNAWSEQARFESVVRAAIRDGVVARPDLGACPIRLAIPTGFRVRTFPVLVVDSVDVGTSIRSQTVSSVLVDATRGDELLDAGRYEEAALYAAALSSPERLRHEVVLVANKHDKPVATGSTSYEPGEIAGHAYLYDFASHAVVCAADVSTKSSGQIGYSYYGAPSAAMNSALERDLDRHLAIAIGEAMRDRAGPPL